jgi:glycosyltransferase involved in cell wall biosynthesis
MMLSVVVPVYNEKPTVLKLIRSVQEVNLEKEIIIVDDYSTDGTREILADLEKEDGISVFYHPFNRGKGAALRTGFQHVKGDIVLIQDADLEYDPQEYHKLIKPIVAGKADVVYGSRFVGGDAHRVHLFWHYMGNTLLTLLSNMTTNLNLTDMESCYKVFKTAVIRKIQVKSNGFGIEPELTAKVARLGCKIYEVSISYSGRDYAEGKKITWKDGINALWSIIRFGIAD